MLKKSISYNGIKPFEFNITYCTLDSKSPLNEFSHHIHEECEIYINLSGDVSFMVENKLYPIQPGSVIITRPYEYHHCIYHSNAIHNHFWILFSSAGNEILFKDFFDRQKGEGNLFNLSPECTEKCVHLCNSMLSEQKNTFNLYYDFFTLIQMITASSDTGKENECPKDVALALKYINENLNAPINITELAMNSFVSVNTLERHFLNYTGISPSAYIRTKRLSNAARLLCNGKSVSDAAELSGFCDYSYFIHLFKKSYGVTPLNYRKASKAQF